MTKTTNHIYEVQTAEGDVVEILRFSTPEEATEFATDINGDYYVKPQTLSAEELLDILLDLREFEREENTNEFIGQIGVDSGLIMIADPCSVKGAITEDGLAAMHCRTNNEYKSGPALSGFNLAFQPGNGDGLYDVYAKFDDAGNIAKVEIKTS
ncbi:hypothetical protein ACTL32_18395 [Planococcus sp. FY231025]|uniref:hypothetical protein n=1 Tax=Planococcus sp. FY231025 TaxID=3455699 RepID=UPI003F8DD3E7